VRTVAQQPSATARRHHLVRQQQLADRDVGNGDGDGVCGQERPHVPVALAFCTLTMANQQVPYWTPAAFAPNVPLNQMTHLT